MSTPITVYKAIGIFNFSYKCDIVFIREDGHSMNIDYKLIGERIKKARKDKNITQEVLAERLNVSIGYISQVERGVTKISLDLLGAISSVLNCNIASLVSESAVRSNDYMETEIFEEIRQLDQKTKRLILKLKNNLNPKINK